ncbi:cation-dependent mannose-6-phosphate receptor-like [Topomyia yanbarensis]|uniref:cation-dependent mannose-6-phosphate receptor-like n=1 Tax=Topomyia yanbarensis TaxID=2498891 RepID=UPI00273C221C|nr:cation-dependent mannose-6-phosphate receptor-like [Topomyia yanbarensis]XP_058826074.1 cation-dependent mannose-6-phosphate receptor-like [Topomyia yanbarensis]
MTNVLLLALVTLLLNGGRLVLAGAANICNKLDACRCEYPDGSGIDLNQVVPKNGDYLETMDPKTQDRYYFHPCSNIKYLDKVGTNCSTEHGYTLCRYNNSTDNYTKLGTANDSNFNTPEDGQKYLVFNTNSIVTTIQLLCLKHDKSYIYVEMDQNLKAESQPKLLLFSPYACTTTIEEISQSSVGQVLLILFFTGTFTYFTIASIVRFVYFGARGIEVIPNLDFWKDLPGLVRDGISFLRGGCHVERTPDPDSYDAI